MTLGTLGSALALAGPASAGPMPRTCPATHRCAYVTDEKANTVSVVDEADMTVIGQVPVGRFPGSVAVDHPGHKAYVANLANNTVSVIDTTTNTVTATVSAGNEPTWTAASPDGSRVAVVNVLSATVSMIDTSTDTVASTIALPAHGGDYMGVPAFSPDSRMLYLPEGVSPTSSYLVRINTSSRTPDGTPDPANDAVTGSYPVDAGARSVAFDPTPSLHDIAYVTVSGSVAVPNGEIQIIDPTTDTPTGKIAMGKWVSGITFNTDGTKAWVSTHDYSNLAHRTAQISEIDVASSTVDSTTSLGQDPSHWDDSLYMITDAWGQPWTAQPESGRLASTFTWPAPVTGFQRPYGLAD